MEIKSFIDEWHHTDNKEAFAIDNKYVVLLDRSIEDNQALICKHSGLEKAGHVLMVNSFVCSTCGKKIPNDVLELFLFIRSAL